MKQESWSLGQALPGAVEKDGISWALMPFEALDVAVLYRVLALRSSVFVVEQDCAFQEIDGLDPKGLIVVGMRQQGEHAFDVVATARILPPGVRFAEPTLGRLCVAAPYRQHGFGRRLMLEAVSLCRERFPAQAIRVSAPAHLEKFHQAFGFQTVSEVYLEDRVPHVEMLLGADVSVS
ncbi:MAG: GNAT family N-acetyltransferase [Lautropia sp.]|nr:GNAT family N-acetyltransferase [Lautropia sp.]